MPTLCTLVEDASNGLFDFRQKRGGDLHDHYSAATKTSAGFDELRALLLVAYAPRLDLSMFDVTAVLSVGLHHADATHSS